MKMKILGSSILAGIAISLGGYGFLALGGGIPGAIAFTFGLITVVSYRWKLFTGVAGFFENASDFWRIWPVLLGNIIGCFLAGQMARYASPTLIDAAAGILDKRLETGILQCGIAAIGCGFIVTTSVVFARQGKWLPLLFGVPLFIICGFPHCVADAFYYMVCIDHWNFDIVPLYFMLVIGNFAGNNLSRVICPEKV